MPALTEVANPSLRIVLRSATQAVHERLHGHDGFASVQNGSIELAAYRKLLIRLYGFYLPFEEAAGDGRHRTEWLEHDLMTLGLDHRRFTVSICQCIPSMHSIERRLGARYVVEGSALGGRGLARGLDTLLGAGSDAGRRFFTGRGAKTSEAWMGYLVQLSQAPVDGARRAEVIDAATETFGVFEQWLAGWKDATRV